MALRVKIRRQWNGNDRGYLRGLQRMILMMQRREQRMAAREAFFDENQFYFDNSPTGVYQAAMDLLLTRIEECLSAKA